MSKEACDAFTFAQSPEPEKRVEVGWGLLSSAIIGRGYTTGAVSTIYLIVSRSIGACGRRLATHQLMVSRSGRAC